MIAPGGFRLRYLEPQTAVCERVVLTDDPRLALEIAQSELERPRMLNHARGLWGYVGSVDGDVPVAVQAAGIGAVSVAAVARELVALGARRLVAVWGCAALERSAALGDLLVVERATVPDPALGALLNGSDARPDAALTEMLLRSGAERGRGQPTAGTVASVAAPFDVGAATVVRALGSGATAIDLAAALLFAVARAEGAAAAAVLCVETRPGPEGPLVPGADRSSRSVGAPDGCSPSEGGAHGDGGAARVPEPWERLSAGERARAYGRAGALAVRAIACG